MFSRSKNYQLDKKVKNIGCAKNINQYYSRGCKGDVKYFTCNITFGPLAQLVEQWTFNPLVVGSNPTWPTKRYILNR